MLAALSLLVALAMVVAFQHRASLEGAHAVHRAQLGSLARVQARSAVQELLAAVASDVNTPGTPMFREIRRHLGSPWEEIELLASLGVVPASIRPSWGKGKRDGEGRAAVEVSELRAVLRSPRALPGASRVDEWTAVLTLGATAEVADAQGRARRRVEESYELRVLRVGLPRPFDELQVVIGDAAALVDTARVNRARERLLEVQDRLMAELESGRQLNADEADLARLEEIVKGMLPAEELARRTPVLPEEPAAYLGFHHLPEARFEELEVVRLVEEAEAEVARRAEALRAARTGKDAVEAVYQLVAAYSMGLELIWIFDQSVNLLPISHPDHAARLAPPLAGVSPEHYLARVTLAGDAGHPLIAPWLAGEARLDGGVDLRESRERLVLDGTLRGRALLLVGPAGVRVESLNRGGLEDGHKLVIVSLGGDVEVIGEAEADVVMLPAPGRGPDSVGLLRLGLRAELHGSILAPHAHAGTLDLRGGIHTDGRRKATAEPATAAEIEVGAFAGEHVVVVSPSPLFVDGGAR